MKYLTVHLHRIALPLLLIPLLGGNASAFGQQETGKASNRDRTAPAANKSEQRKANDGGSKNLSASQRILPVKLTTDQQEVALKFARKHHPELATLLERLRKSSPEGFNRGIREIHNASLRLKRYQEKQPARFEQELRNWRIDSEIRLLTARWAVSQNKKLEEQIQDLMRARQESRLDQMRAERERLARRLAELDDRIGMGTADLEADLQSEWERLKKRTSSSVKSRKRANAKRSSEKSRSNKPETKPDSVSVRSGRNSDETKSK